MLIALRMIVIEKIVTIFIPKIKEGQHARQSVHTCRPYIYSTIKSIIEI